MSLERTGSPQPTRPAGATPGSLSGSSAGDSAANSIHIATPETKATPPQTTQDRTASRTARTAADLVPAASSPGNAGEIAYFSTGGTEVSGTPRIFDNGTNIGIGGTINPITTLHVVYDGNTVPGIYPRGFCLTRWQYRSFSPCRWTQSARHARLESSVQSRII